LYFLKIDQNQKFIKTLDIMQTTTLNLSPFPSNIGKILEYKPFDFTSRDFKNLEIPTKTIVRLYGVVGSGKGTLAGELCRVCPFTNLETSNILRSATWIYKQLELDFDDRNTDLVFSQVELQLVAGCLQFFWKGNKLGISELRSSEVDQSVSIFSGNSHFRQLYYDKINYILENLIDSPVILDGRGCSTPYLQRAEKNGFKIIRIFLFVNKEVSYDRYLSRLGKVENESNKSELQAGFVKKVLDRDQQDYQNTLSNNLGTISPDTGIIDTSNLSPEQVLETAIRFVAECL
jgi:cytidylate kinase